MVCWVLSGVIRRLHVSNWSGCVRINRNELRPAVMGLITKDNQMNRHSLFCVQETSTGLDCSGTDKI